MFDSTPEGICSDGDHLYKCPLAHCGLWSSRLYSSLRPYLARGSHGDLTWVEEISGRAYEIGSAGLCYLWKSKASGTVSVPSTGRRDISGWSLLILPHLRSICVVVFLFSSLSRGVRTQSAVVYRLLHKRKRGKKSQSEEGIRAGFSCTRAAGKDLYT